MQPSMGYQVIPRDPLDFPPEDAHVYPPSTSKIHDRIIYILTHEKVRSKVVATLGATRADTAAIAQNAFPALREYAPEQIGFYLGDARILDVAWPHLFAHPPAEVNISVIHRTSDPGIGRVDMGTEAPQQWSEGVRVAFLTLLAVWGLTFVLWASILIYDRFASPESGANVEHP